MRETLLIFAGFGTVLGKAFHLWTKSTWEANPHWEKIIWEGIRSTLGEKLSEQEKNVPPCLQIDTSKSNNPVSTCHLTL